jgi:tight adherence protein B
MNVTAAIVALSLASGVLLVVSPFLWPRKRNHGVTNASDGPPGEFRKIASVRRRARRLLDDAGFARVATRNFLALNFLMCPVVAGVVLLLSPVWVLAVCAAAVSGVAPWMFLVNRRTRRANQRAALWPDVSDTLISNIRAGRSIVEAVAALGETYPGSIGAAARLFDERTRSSANVTECLSELKSEWADPAGDRIVEALRVTRDVGGTRLTTVLRELSRTLRRELAVRREIVAKQSWIRVAAGIGSAAPWVVVVLLASRPEAATAYQSVAGASLICGGLAISVIAYHIMIRIGRLRPEKRWFA